MTKLSTNSHLSISMVIILYLLFIWRQIIVEEIGFTRVLQIAVRIGGKFPPIKMTYVSNEYEINFHLFISISFILQIKVYLIHIHHICFCLCCIYFNLIVSFIFLSNPVFGNQGLLQIKFNPTYILYHLKRNSDGITTPCYFIRNTI